MLLLFETPVGYALFKVENSKKSKKSIDDGVGLEDQKSVLDRFKLRKLSKFDDTTDALASIVRVNDGKLNKHIKSLVKKCIVSDGVQEELAVGDSKLASLIKEKFSVDCVSSNEVNEMMRVIRLHQSLLLPDVEPKDIRAMSLALAHSVSRYKMKFSADKIDTMVIQAINLLDDLDKELNNYLMRCREWYAWHFPELGNIITDNQTYVKVVHRLKFKENIATVDLTDLVPETVAAEIKAAAEVSMGTEISASDMENIDSLCEQIIDINQYRSHLSEYLHNRIRSIAPNLTVIVGELVGARLISHAGSLLNLAKHPSSTVQIIGAEKALFRALKSHSRNTPKYGLIYYSTVVSQVSAKLKGKASRMLAAKASLAARCDALSESEVNTELAVQNRAKLEQRLKMLEDQSKRAETGHGKFRPGVNSYQPNSSGFRSFNPRNDMVLPTKPFKRPPDASLYEEEHDDDNFQSKKRKLQEESEDTLLPGISSETQASTDGSVKKKKRSLNTQPKFEKQ